MSFSLPLQGTEAREACGDIFALAEILNPANVNKLPTFREAINLARGELAHISAAKSINIVCLRANDERWLIQVGRRGAWKQIWNFGDGR